jgi:hypothetical protein
MTDRENFLERWSRRKREAADVAAGEPLPPTDDRPPTQAVAPDDKQADAPAGEEAAPPACEEAAPPAFDLSKLPSLDSITAASDVRAFLAPGVPQHLARAALRRAWAADPAIRDFVGLQENDWDFTRPDSVPGFGDLPPGYDVKKVVAQLFGGQNAPRETVSQSAPPAHPESTAESQGTAEQTAAPSPATAPERSFAELTTRPGELPPASSEDNIVRRDSDIASQYLSPQEEPKQRKPAHKHGGALPKC